MVYIESAYLLFQHTKKQSTHPFSENWVYWTSNYKKHTFKPELKALWVRLSTSIFTATCLELDLPFLGAKINIWAVMKRGTQNGNTIILISTEKSYFSLERVLKSMLNFVEANTSGVSLFLMVNRNTFSTKAGNS